MPPAPTWLHRLRTRSLLPLLQPLLQLLLLRAGLRDSCSHLPLLESCGLCSCPCPCCPPCSRTRTTLTQQPYRRTRCSAFPIHNPQLLPGYGRPST